MLRKQYVKSRNVFKVSFTLPEAELPEGTKVESVFLVGDFNNWEKEATPLKRHKHGLYQATVELEPGQSYQFRYLVNGEEWCNDWAADAYQANPYGSDNCVVIAELEEAGRAGHGG